MPESNPVASEDELKRIIASPTLFSYTVLGFKPTRYQAELMEADSNALVVWGRQCGKTTTLAIKALHFALTHPEREVLIIAPTQRQASLMFDKIYNYCQYNEFIKTYVPKLTLGTIAFRGGSRIHCLPAGHEGSSIRGYSASLIIFDEAALIPDAVFMAVQPSMAVRGEQMVLSGTPFGRQGFFYNQYRLNELKAVKLRTWNVFRVRAEECPYIDKDWLEGMKLSMPADQYAQEFEGEFVADASQFFPSQLVVAAMDDYQYVLPEAKKFPATTQLCLGVDVARAGADDTALCLCSVTQDNYYKVEWTEQHSHSLTTETAGRVVELAAMFPDMKIYVDETGLGGGVVDILKERNVSVTGVSFSVATRNRMYTGLKLALEQRRLKFSTEDRKMAGQFSNYSGKQTSDGRYMVVKGAAHDDCVDALALCFAGENELEWVEFGEGMQLNPIKRMVPAKDYKWSFGIAQ